MIATSVADLQWLDSIPGDRPVLVVAEGLVQYLPESDRDAVFNRITEQFPSGESSSTLTAGPRPRCSP
jgi:O-methyltransferase involved in polyketide biosynthesis